MIKERYLFRGKSLDSKEFVSGCLWNNHKSGLCYIGAVGENGAFEKWVEVYISTIGQCAGLKDADGRLIFEGDILEGWTAGEKKFYAAVVWNIDGWVLKDGGGQEDLAVELMDYDLFIVGNIHDNPELLTVPESSVKES